MNYNIKIKSKAKENQPYRSFKTDHFDQSNKTRTEAIGKQSANCKKLKQDQKHLYQQKHTLHHHKHPLQQNNQLLNQTQISLGNANPVRSREVKSVLMRQPTKTITEPLDKGTICQAQKIAMKKIFNCSSLPKDQHENLKLDSSKNRDSFNPRKETKGAEKQTHALHALERYTFQKQVGSGTFGTVHKARDKKTLEVVAIKKVFQDRKYKNRELDILKILDHTNVLKMRDSFFTHQNGKEYLNVVMDYYPCNLYECIQKYRTRTQMPRLKFKVLAYQLFRSLLYLQQVGIVHRDIKPQNILVNDSNWKLIMCDFGSAKCLQPGEPNISYICSRCYRAPQLIFGNTTYDTQIDMWSVGCVLGQMITCQPIFRGQSNIDQLVEIIRVLGTPTLEQVTKMNPQCEFNHYQLPRIRARSWTKVIECKLGADFYELLECVLVYDPTKRLSPLQALTHPFFDQLRNKITYQKLRKEFNIPDLFGGDSMPSTNIDKLVPAWYKEH